MITIVYLTIKKYNFIVIFIFICNFLQLSYLPCRFVFIFLFLLDLRRTTPAAFKSALLETERWASSTGDQQSTTDNSNHSGSGHNNNSYHGSGHGNTKPVSGGGVSPRPALAAVSVDDDDVYGDAENMPNKSNMEGSDAEIGSNNTSTTTGAKTTLMDRFRRLSTATNTVFGSKSKGKDDKRLDYSANATRNIVHESKSSMETVCLWVDSAEVVPCLTSNRRRPGEIITVCDAFIAGVSASFDATNSSNSFHTRTASGNEVIDTASTGSSRRDCRGCAGVCLPEDDNAATHAAPFYFGLDCRPVEERVLGRFPKVNIISIFQNTIMLFIYYCLHCVYVVYCIVWK